MAIKKQNKRPLEDAAAGPAQNGSPSKKPKNQSKKVKTEKVQKKVDNSVPVTNLQKIKKTGAASNEQPPKKPIIKQEQAPLPADKLAKIAAKKLKNAKKHAKQLANRKEARKEGGGQYRPETTSLSVEEIQLRIDQIVSRPELTKTAKRRLVVWRKRLLIAKGTYIEKPKPESTGLKLTPSQKRHGRKIRSKARRLEDKLKEKTIVSDKVTSECEPSAAMSVKQESAVSKGKPSKPGKQQQQKGKGKGAKQPIVKKEEPEESEEDDDDDQEAEDEEDSNEEVDNKDGDDSEVEEEEEEDDDDDDEEKEEEEDDDDEEKEEEEDDDDDEEDEEEEEEEKEVAVPAKKPKQKVMKKEPEGTKKPFVKKENAKGHIKNGPAANGDSQDKKKTRYVLFVGNLPYEANPEEITKHFLTKVSDVVNVRVPNKPGSNTPRGFAYVEVTNETDYQKGLSLHNTILMGRKLNVEYTRGGSKSVGNRTDVVAKNKKLHAMRKQGMLAGSQKEGHSRNDRRQKARQSSA